MFMLACVHAASNADAAGRNGTAGPRVLSPAELDAITSSGSTVSLELSAEAQGAAPTALTKGSIRSIPDTILLLRDHPERPAIARYTLIGNISVELLFAIGSASASGADPHASVTLVQSGAFAYAQQVSETTLTPTTASQTVALFAIAIATSN